MGNVPDGFRRLNNPRMNSLLCHPVQILNLFKYEWKARSTNPDSCHIHH
jgi:hypothetical protein